MESSLSISYALGVASKEGHQCNNLTCVRLLVVGRTVLLFYMFIFSTLHVITPLVLYIDSKFLILLNNMMRAGIRLEYVLVLLASIFLVMFLCQLLQSMHVIYPE